MLVEQVWEWPQRPRRRRGGLLRPPGRVAKAAGTRLFKAATRNHDFRRQSSEGVIDFAGRRYMLDHGSYSQLYAGGQEWDGRSGRLLATLSPEEMKRPTPLWLLDILAGLTAATDAGTEEVRGTSCRRVAAIVDLGRASKATSGGVAVPRLARFEELLALPVDVWVDDTHVRRVRYEHGFLNETVELWDFDVQPQDLDWTRLPTFRSPNEAAQVAGQHTPRWRRTVARVIGAVAR
jgi:hypothetical protein